MKEIKTKHYKQAQQNPYEIFNPQIQEKMRKRDARLVEEIMDEYNIDPQEAQKLVDKVVRKNIKPESDKYLIDLMERFDIGINSAIKIIQRGEKERFTDENWSIMYFMANQTDIGITRAVSLISHFKDKGAKDKDFKLAGHIIERTGTDPRDAIISAMEMGKANFSEEELDEAMSYVTNSGGDLSEAVKEIINYNKAMKGLTEEGSKMFGKERSQGWLEGAQEESERLFPAIS